ncbi:ExbD/TolR family protein [Thermocoleostomius sinensis]|uniref:Biopolymer transporter ExbD n=1 Tax=Thermocoleostomius sinensis A174 TaxID=2016057 RepID=A0A9E8ZGK2_9CYAN|nr:biopolymer transporter ExbD [Thermocoleostomius sinensis]WAL62707.1 biopolymer transporter ExbD [Thermocoleostomius sinensis A174]
MKWNYENPEEEVRIELVPLIDVIFCILTFFILAAVTLTRQTAINVDLPRANTGATQLRELLIVSVDPIGQTYIEKQPVSRQQLYDALLNFRQTSADGLIVLYASRAASYNDVVQVLDLLRSVGGSRVALATLPASADGQPFQLPELTPGSEATPSLPEFDPVNPSPLELPDLTTPTIPSPNSDSGTSDSTN